MGKYLYMAVTRDKFEFPIVVEENAVELAHKLSIDPMTVYNSVSNNFSGKKLGYKILRVKSL
jgi:hypothetical protein